MYVKNRYKNSLLQTLTDPDFIHRGKHLKTKATLVLGFDYFIRILIRPFFAIKPTITRPTPWVAGNQIGITILFFFLITSVPYKVIFTSRQS